MGLFSGLFGGINPNDPNWRPPKGKPSGTTIPKLPTAGQVKDSEERKKKEAEDKAKPSPSPSPSSDDGECEGCYEENGCTYYY